MADELIDLEPLPSRVNRPETLDDDTEGLFAKLPAWARQIFQARGEAVAASEAGAGGYAFLFDTAVTATAPAAGNLRWNNANATLADRIHVSATTSTGSVVGPLIDTFDDSDSGVKGTIRLVSARDPANFAVFKLVSVDTPASGWRTLNVIPVSSSGPNPFTANMPVGLQFAQNGDRGLQGPAGSTLAADVEADLIALTLAI